MKIDRHQVEATTSRYQERKRFRTRNERLIEEGRYLSVDTPERVEKFVARRATDPDTANSLRAMAPGTTIPEALERALGTNDLMGVAFLERGLQVARTVGKIWVGLSSGRALAYGTGFLVSPRLLLTNQHVLKNREVARSSVVEFNYQIELGGTPATTTTFALDPDAFFVMDPHLDYALVAVRGTGTGGRGLAAFGWNPLIEDQGKAIISQWLNIIQHPNGEPKQLGLRENQLVDLLDDFIHYKTDTAPGSSGAPVFNDRWEVVGLHHSGVWETNAAGQILAVDGRVWTEGMGEHRIKWVANEGARISRLVAHLREQPLKGEERRLFEELFAAPSLPTETTPKAHPAVAADPNVAQVASDGSATWTIPLSVSVRLGTGSASQTEMSPPPAVTPPAILAAVPTSDQVLSAGSPEEILGAARRELGGRSDVLKVQLGYLFKNGWITDDRALVVTVRQKLSLAALREARVGSLPETFMGLPVEVTGPSLEDLIRLARGPVATEAALSGPAVLREEITYVPPAGAPLQRITAPMRVIAHISPDIGWPQLSTFLEATRQQLVIGMYDFGAPYIADAVAGLAKKSTFRKLTLIMQKGESVGEGTKADDLKDSETVDKLREALGDRFENAWVKIGSVNGWVASSYHIKVAVRDHKALWLSSGNWQSSNQPDAAPLNENPPQRSWLDRYNREWHAVVEHEELAKALEARLLHDFKNNLDVDAREARDLPDLLIPEAFFSPSPEERATPFRYFPPFDADRVFSVTPLLSPDNYHENVLELIRGASDELLIQNQTFNAPKEDHEKLHELIDAVVTRHEAGVRVRVIFRLLFPSLAREVLSELKDYGVPTSIVKVQKNCHTKGIVVDRKKVLLGSQNWSNDGVSVNRDASLLFEDEELARYFADIFEHDWNYLAKQDIGSERLAVEWATAGAPTSAKMLRLSWKDYMEAL